MLRRPITGLVALALAGSGGLTGAQAAGASVNSVIYYDDFETATGWTVNPNATDTATGGLWERGHPQGTSGLGPIQLGTTVSGTNDLVTGSLAGYSVASHDVDDGVTSIQSPPIALPSTGTLSLSFSWYLAHGNNSSTADFFRVKVVGTTTSQVFGQLGAAGAVRNGAWSTATANISSYAGQTVHVLIEAADASDMSLVEAGVDDLTIAQS